MIDVFPLFSNPVMKHPVDLTGLDLSSVVWGPNYNNSISQSQTVLEQEPFLNLKEECMKGVREYFYNMMSVTDSTEIYITESWFNSTAKDEVHHRHWHPNSIVSGIVYIASEEDQGGDTSFITSKYETIELDIKESNLYNSKSWSIPPSNGEMLLFPSSVEHFVTPYTGTTPRITLSFNTFVKGNVNDQALTRLAI
tara:strand:- start:1343 stop:1930 length:588 start_codon:yes stop_codon:yes gene_type:complete